MFSAYFVLAVLLGILGITEASAQAQKPRLFYFVTKDNNSHSTSIWQANTQTNVAQRLTTVRLINSETPNSIFPEHELSELNAAINRGSFLQSNVNTPGVTQAVTGVWLLDSNRLLVQTSNDVCDRVAGGCYGYFEFLTLDIPSTSLTSLLKVDYHNVAVQSWSECPLGAAVYIDSVLPNPTQNSFAFTLRPISSCHPMSRSQAYIVDYAASPIAVSEIPFAGGVAWSPDGTYLAYYSRDTCQDIMCATSVKLLSISPGAIPITITSASFPFTTPLFVEWLDDRTVMYQWLLSLGGTADGTRVLRWHDIMDNHSLEVSALPFQQNGVYHLNRDQLHIFAVYPDGSAVGLKAEKVFHAVSAFPSVANISYNSRFPQYLFINLESSKITVVDSNLIQASIDLADFVSPLLETVIFVTNGDI